MFSQKASDVWRDLLINHLREQTYELWKASQTPAIEKDVPVNLKYAYPIWSMANAQYFVSSAFMVPTSDSPMPDTSTSPLLFDKDIPLLKLSEGSPVSLGPELQLKEIYINYSDLGFILIEPRGTEGVLPKTVLNQTTGKYELIYAGSGAVGPGSGVHRKVLGSLITRLFPEYVRFNITITGVVDSATGVVRFSGGISLTDHELDEDEHFTLAGFTLYYQTQHLTEESK